MMIYMSLESRSIHKQQFLRNTNMPIAFIMENPKINQLKKVQIINSFGAIFITSQFSDPWQILSQFEFLIPYRWFKLKKGISSSWNNIIVDPSKTKAIKKYIYILFRIIKMIFFPLLISWTIPTRGPKVAKIASSKHLKPWRLSKLWIWQSWVHVGLHRGPENLKKSRPKNLWNQINQFHEFFFDQVPFFAISKLAKNQFLDWENVFKIAKNAISRNFFFDLFDFTNFLA